MNNRCVCQFCSIEFFTDQRSDTRYCSKSCFNKNKTKNQKERKKIYYENNKEKIKLAVYSRRSKIKNSASFKDKLRKYQNSYRNERKQRDIDFKIRIHLRSRLATALTIDSKSGSAVKDLGCSIAQLKAHLESLFQPGMTWDNWSKDGWHIDHIKPLSSFDLTIRDEFLKACHYTNLQPLWAKDNLTKSCKLI